MSRSVAGDEEPSQLNADEERTLVLHSLRWVNSGGAPDSEIAERFGYTGRTYFQRVLAILGRESSQPVAFGLGPVVTARIKAVARGRVWESP